jgi:hypothetical protein
LQRNGLRILHLRHRVFSFWWHSPGVPNARVLRANSALAYKKGVRTGA